MARRRAVEPAKPRNAAGGFPPELLDEGDPAWVDDETDKRANTRASLSGPGFHIWFGRRRRAKDALHAWGMAHGLADPVYPKCLDWGACRALAERHGQRWPPKRLLRDNIEGAA